MVWQGAEVQSPAQVGRCRNPKPWGHSRDRRKDRFVAAGRLARRRLMAFVSARCNQRSLFTRADVWQMRNVQNPERRDEPPPVLTALLDQAFGDRSQRIGRQPQIADPRRFDPHHASAGGIECRQIRSHANNAQWFGRSYQVHFGVRHPLEPIGGPTFVAGMSVMIVRVGASLLDFVKLEI